MAYRRLLTVVMDGVGINKGGFGNAVELANTPFLNHLKRVGLYTELVAHGTAVGLPSNSDMGNSEVGHNALGAGRIYDQGAKLIQNAFADGSIWHGHAWRKIVEQLKASKGTLHLIGLLSDGNIHSHEEHLHLLLQQAKKSGISRVRIHALLDGRDVPEKSAEIYIGRLHSKLKELEGPEFDARIASGGGRMNVTMDRYEADWRIVERGWRAHVHGEADARFPCINKALEQFRQNATLTDQDLPAFAIWEDGLPVGKMNDGDAVVLFNFRGDRAIEISRAFIDEEFSYFDRGKVPNVLYAGMMEYDGDLKIPENFLVEPPMIKDTLGEFLASKGVPQFACSETQKFGHVTFFWNGNRSGKFDDKLETYVEIPSELLPFDQIPWMKAREITEETIKALRTDEFSSGRINFANGDMVGHTGNLEAAVIAVSTVDYMIGRLMKVCEETHTILLVTADHGNCDEMFDGAGAEYSLELDNRPQPKTSHTLNPVPFYLYDPLGVGKWKVAGGAYSIGNVAGTICALMGIQSDERFLPSILEKT